MYIQKPGILQYKYSTRHFPQLEYQSSLHFCSCGQIRIYLCLLWTFSPPFNIWKGKDGHHFGGHYNFYFLIEFKNLEFALFSKGYAYLNRQGQMRNAFILYFSLGDCRSTPEKTILLKTCMSLKLSSGKTSNLSAGLLRTASAWRTFWSVQYLSEGKLLYTPSPANLNIWFSSAFSPRWEKNKAARRRTTIPRLECTPKLTE